MKVSCNNNTYRIAIPKDIIKEKKWEKGTNLLVSVGENDTVVLKEIKD